MAKFILILREDPASSTAMSPAEMQATVEKYMAWSAGLAQAGRLHSGEKLSEEGGRRLTRRDGRLLVTDGPYAEVKDVIGGIFIIEAADYAEAETLIADCPHLDVGEIELRRIDEL